MNTPICDFVQRYADSGTMRLHMPGHKGREPLDITEIRGADSLYDATGIIRESEENAGRLFGCHTFYATQGSSQCIRAMLHLALQEGLRRGRKPVIAALRNAHRAFLTAAAMLDLEITWLYGEESASYLSCPVTAEQVEQTLEEMEEKPFAVYLTSPDYLGNLLDVAPISTVCRKYGCLLLVDNAHGAYLRFLEKSLHPMDLGADLCCDSAHKTLPVLTGGAYLHIRDKKLAAQAKNALSMYGSTSPSYLILQSLDRVNPVLESWKEPLREFLAKVAAVKASLEKGGYTFVGDEPMKLTLDAKAYGYTGDALADHLRGKGIECEFSDPDYVVLMPAPAMTDGQLTVLQQALLAIPQKPVLTQKPPALAQCEQVLSVRQAMLAPSKNLPVEASCGSILASPCVGCPPAVPILICGQRINDRAIAAFRYYGIDSVTVTER